MSSASLRMVSGVNFIFCHGGSVTNTGFPLTQVTDILFANFSFASAPNGDARIKILGLSKGKESCHISTVPYDSVREIARQNKISIASSGSKIRIVTLPGLRRLMAVHQRRVNIQALKPLIDACVEALSQPTSSRLAPLSLVDVTPKAATPRREPFVLEVESAPAQQLPLLLEAKPEVRDSSVSSSGTSSNDALNAKIDYMTSRINELMEIVNRRSPLSARFQWIAIPSVAEIFETDTEPVEMIIRVQFVANTLIQERKAEGYDIQYTPPPSSTPLLSHRLARLVVDKLEKEGFRVKYNYVRP